MLNLQSQVCYVGWNLWYWLKHNVIYWNFKVTFHYMVNTSKNSIKLFENLLRKMLKNTPFAVVTWNFKSWFVQKQQVVLMLQAGAVKRLKTTKRRPIEDDWNINASYDGFTLFSITWGKVPDGWESKHRLNLGKCTSVICTLTTWPSDHLLTFDFIHTLNILLLPIYTFCVFRIFWWNH